MLGPKSPGGRRCKISAHIIDCFPTPVARPQYHQFPKVAWSRQRPPRPPHSAAAEAAESPTAAARRIAGTPTHGYAATRDGGFLPRVGDGTQGPRNLRACFFVPYSEASVSWLPISKFIARSGR